MTAPPGHARWCQLGEHPPGVPCSEIVPDPRYAALAGHRAATPPAMSAPATRREGPACAYWAGPNLNTCGHGSCMATFGDPDPVRRVHAPGGPAAVVTEYATLMPGGGWHVRWDHPEAERIYPLAEWIAHMRRSGATVGRRRVVVVEGWTEVEEP